MDRNFKGQFATRAIVLAAATLWAGGVMAQNTVIDFSTTPVFTFDGAPGTFAVTAPGGSVFNGPVRLNANLAGAGATFSGNVMTMGNSSISGNQTVNGFQVIGGFLEVSDTFFADNGIVNFSDDITFGDNIVLGSSQTNGNSFTFGDSFVAGSQDVLGSLTVGGLSSSSATVESMPGAVGTPVTTDNGNGTSTQTTTTTGATDTVVSTFDQPAPAVIDSAGNLTLTQGTRTVTTTVFTTDSTQTVLVDNATGAPIAGSGSSAATTTASTPTTEVTPFGGNLTVGGDAQVNGTLRVGEMTTQQDVEVVEATPVDGSDPRIFANDGTTTTVRTITGVSGSQEVTTTTTNTGGVTADPLGNINLARGSVMTSTQTTTFETARDVFIDNDSGAVIDEQDRPRVNEVIGDALVTEVATPGGNLSMDGNLVVGTAGCNAVAADDPLACGNARINGALSVVGATTTNGIVNVGAIATDTLSTTGAATVGGPLTVAGATTTNGIANVGAIATDTLSVAGATATNGIANTGVLTTTTLATTGAATVGGALNVAGATATNGISNTGNLANSGAINTATLATTGAATVGGALSVAGATTTNGLHNTGGITNAGGLTNAGGIANTGGLTTDTLTASGAAVFNGPVTMNGAVQIGAAGRGISVTPAGTTIAANNGASGLAVGTDGAALVGNGARIDLNDTSAALLNSTGHGVSVSATETVISGGTSTTNLTLNDAGAEFDTDGRPARVSGIADGRGRFDAVNFGQLEKNREQLAQGIASVVAMTNIPEVAPGKRFAFGIGVGGYDSEAGYAIGASVRFTPSTALKASVGTGSEGNKATYGLGFAASF